MERQTDKISMDALQDITHGEAYYERGGSQYGLVVTFDGDGWQVTRIPFGRPREVNPELYIRVGQDGGLEAGEQITQSEIDSLLRDISSNKAELLRDGQNR